MANLNYDKTRLVEVEKRCEAATEGPWEVYRERPAFVWMQPYGKGSIGSCCVKSGRAKTGHDCKFIAHARTDLPDAIQDIRTLLDENKELRHKLKWGRWTCVNCGSLIRPGGEMPESVNPESAPICSSCAEVEIARQAMRQIAENGVPFDEIGSSERWARYQCEVKDVALRFLAREEAATSTEPTK